MNMTAAAGSTLATWGNWGRTVVNGALQSVGARLPNLLFTSTSGAQNSAEAASTTEAHAKIMNYKVDRSVRHPLCTAVTLAIFNYLPQGTKLGLKNYTILIQAPALVSQATERSDNRDHHMELIDALESDIKTLTEWYSTRNYEIYSLFRLSIWGLRQLKGVYAEPTDANFRSRVDILISNLCDCCIYKPTEIPLKLERNILLRNLFTKAHLAIIQLTFQIKMVEAASSSSTSSQTGNTGEQPTHASSAGSAAGNDGVSEPTSKPANSKDNKASEANKKEHKSKNAVIKEEAATAAAAVPKPVIKNLPEWLKDRECENPSDDRIALIKKDLEILSPKQITRGEDISNTVKEVNEQFRYHFNLALQGWASLREPSAPKKEAAASAAAL